MEKENIVKNKSFDFAVKVVRLAYQIQKEKKEYDLSRQIIRSATSIGANIEESMGGQSNKDFLHKISISYKEARETDYWLRLMLEVELITKVEQESLLKDAQEILRLLGAIRRTMQQKVKAEAAQNQKKGNLQLKD
jgi:four helix bundle protein